MPTSLGQLLGLLGWGTLVGVDLVSFPQAMLSRPLIAGAGAGLVLGEPVAGLQIGLLLELFALDVLPVGAARYPDYGPGVIGAVVLASGVELTFVQHCPTARRRHSRQGQLHHRCRADHLGQVGALDE